MRQRIFAILGAILLVAAAVAVRGLLVKDKSGRGSGAGRGGQGQASQKPVVACTPDLKSVCDALAKDGSIADNTPSLDLLEAASPPSDIDGWITWDPAPQIANIDRQGTWDGATVLASSPLAVIVSQDDLVSALQKQCTGRLTWTCVAGAGGPELPIGIGSVATSEGIARIAPLASSLVRKGDPTDVAVDVGQRLLSSPPGGQDSAATMSRSLVSAPGTVSLVVGPVKVLDRAASTASGVARKLRVLTPAGGNRAAVVLSARSGRSLGDVETAVNNGASTTALAAAGMEPIKARAANSDVAGALWQLREKLA